MAETCSKLIKLDRDIIGRLGGEEFAIILYEKTGTDGYKKAEEIRKAVSKETYEVNGEKHSFTVSIGVTTINNGVRITSYNVCYTKLLRDLQHGLVA